MLDEEVNPNDKSIRKNMMCNHCMFDCENYDKMKEHYKSEFHKYNLNRVTMNLNPLLYNEYLKKKEQYQKKLDEMNKLKIQVEQKEQRCDLCQKKFTSNQKYNEHIVSKSHIKMENEHKKKQQEEALKPVDINAPVVQPKKKEDEKTTLDDVTICLFCNMKHENLEKNIYHMVDIHKLDVPFLFCIKNYQKLIDLLAKKIFKHNACLTCDIQKFNSYHSLQNHMKDKGHTRINKEDLDDYLYKYYDMKKLLALKDTNFRKMEEFKVLALRYKVAKRLKEKDLENNKVEEAKENDEDDEGNDWEAVEEEGQTGDKTSKKLKKEVEEEEEDADYEPMELPNGELLLEDGTVLGNKIYNIYYKQRIHLTKYDALQQKVKETFNAKRGMVKRTHAHNKKGKKMSVVQGSNKSNFQRINSLFKPSPQS